MQGNMCYVNSGYPYVPGGQECKPWRYPMQGDYMCGVNSGYPYVPGGHGPISIIPISSVPMTISPLDSVDKLAGIGPIGRELLEDIGFTTVDQVLGKYSQFHGMTEEQKKILFETWLKSIGILAVHAVRCYKHVFMITSAAYLWVGLSVPKPIFPFEPVDKLVGIGPKGRRCLEAIGFTTVDHVVALYRYFQLFGTTEEERKIPFENWLRCIGILAVNAQKCYNRVKQLVNSMYVPMIPAPA